MRDNKTNVVRRVYPSPIGSSGSLVGICAVLAVWEIASAQYGSLLLPSPRAALQELAGLWQQGEVVSAAAATAVRALAGFLAAAALGVSFGLLAGRSLLAARLLEPISTLLLSVPPIAWVVLAIIWFQGDLLIAMFTVAATTLPITFAAAQAGGQTVDPDLDEMVRAYRLRGRQRLTWLMLPHIIAYVFPALTTALGIAWKVTVMTELLALADGMGAEMAGARASLDTASTLAWIVHIAGLLIALEHGLLRPLQRHSEPWRRV